MKVPKTFNIEAEFLDLLKKTNASDLVNELLRDHFNDVDTYDVKKLKLALIEERAIIDNATLKIQHINKKLKEIEDAERKAKETLKYQKEFAEYNTKVTELNEKWKNEEITEEDYWNLLDELKKEKP